MNTSQPTFNCAYTHAQHRSKRFSDMADLGDIQIITKDVSQLQVMCRCCNVVFSLAGEMLNLEIKF